MPNFLTSRPIKYICEAKEGGALKRPAVFIAAFLSCYAIEFIILYILAHALNTYSSRVATFSSVLIFCFFYLAIRANYKGNPEDLNGAPKTAKGWTCLGLKLTLVIVFGSALGIACLIGFGLYIAHHNITLPAFLVGTG